MLQLFRWSQGVRLCLVLVALLFGPRAAADPLAELYYQNFYLAPIGRWNTTTFAEFRTSMLSKVGGVEPANIKLAYCEVTSSFMQHTHGGYYDYVYEPNYPNVNNPTDPRGWELHRLMDYAIANGARVGSHVNGNPWGDDEIQSRENLGNFLEKYNDGTHGPGSLLQRDRTGNFRNAALTQEPTANEGSAPGYAAPVQLEMQLTLSPYATTLENYWQRNLLQATRLFQYYRDLHPDLVIFVSGSSEVAQNIHANNEYADYGPYSRAQFIDWLSGAGIYAGAGQYATLADFNTDFTTGSGTTPSGFPYASWSAVTPPTLVQWDTSRRGRWWQKWHAFRIHQVWARVQAQTDAANRAGWSPDRNFGHQIPGVIGDTGNNAKYATPLNTAFTVEGGNGITTYLGDAVDQALFNTMAANDPIWGIFEYNPITLSGSTVVPSTYANALDGLTKLWNSGARAISPYLWDGGSTGWLAGYTIKGNPFELALQDFIQSKQATPPAAPPRYAVSPDAREPIWAMDKAADIESSSGFSSLSFANGSLAAVTNSTTPVLVPAFAEGPVRKLIANDYHAVAFLMELSSAAPGAQGRFSWTDEFGATQSIDFPVVAGQKLYRINLGERSTWRGRRLHGISVRPINASGVSVKLLWLKLAASFNWNFDDVNEVFDINNMASAGVTGGQFVGTDTNTDGYFSFSTDVRTFGADADRVVIDANRQKLVRFSITASQAGVAELFWWKRGQPIMSFQLLSGIPIAAGMQEVTLDMSNVAGWDGTITRLRLDPIGTAGATVQIADFNITPRLLAPVPLIDDVILNTNQPVFRWDTPLEPDHAGVTYDFQLATDFDFGAVVASQTAISGGEYTLQIPAALDGHHWWRVRARDGGGKTSGWSVPMPVFLRRWEGNSLQDVYSAADGAAVAPNDLSAISVSGGVWRGTASDVDGNSNIDPFLFLNNGGVLARGINASVYKYFQARIRYTGASGTASPVIYFQKDGVYYLVPAGSVAKNGQWFDVNINMGSNPNWSGYVQGLRLDPDSGGGYTFEMDWAQVAPSAIVPTELSSFSAE